MFPDNVKSLLKGVNPDRASKIDEADGNTTYIGEADPGTTGEKNRWKIKKISKSGTVTSIQWAEGNTKFEHVWDNRASLNYS